MSQRCNAEVYLEEVALWCLTSSSFTTCFTSGTCSASFWTDERRSCEGTVPFKVTTPLETSYRTLSFNLCCTSIASRFLSMPESRSESTFFAVPSSPFGRTPISFDTTSLPRNGLGNRFRSRLIVVCPDFAAEGNKPFISILTNTYIVQTSLVQSVADVIGNVGGFAPVQAFPARLQLR